MMFILGGHLRSLSYIPLYFQRRMFQSDWRLKKI